MYDQQDNFNSRSKNEYIYQKNAHRGYDQHVDTNKNYGGNDRESQNMGNFRNSKNNSNSVNNQGTFGFNKYNQDPNNFPRNDSSKSKAFITNFQKTTHITANNSVKMSSSITPKIEKILEIRTKIYSKRTTKSTIPIDKVGKWTP